MPRAQHIDRREARSRGRDRRRGAQYRRDPRRAQVAARRRRAGAVRPYAMSARQRLRQFRRGTILAVALVALLLMLWPGAAAGTDHPAAETGASQPLVQGSDAAAPAADSAPAEEAVPDPSAAVREATGALRSLILRGYGLLPKIGIVLLIALVAWGVARAARFVIGRTLRGWDRAAAASALAGVVVTVGAIAVSVSVLAGDATALVGSVGLIGLALSWALQTPIESFTGWLLNSFRGYYRVGDRIAVGEAFGDVYRIDILTTTVWEAGGPDKPVQGAQATGALITFPNYEVLRSNIVNYTRDFPYVWDEVVFGVANETDLGYAARVFRETARREFGDLMRAPAEEYRALLARAGLPYEIAEEPTVFVSTTDAWTNITVRYIVPARERRRWASDLVLAIAAETARPEHQGRIVQGYPRAQIEVLGDRGPAVLSPPTA